MSSAQLITDTASSTVRDWRELASREGDGLEISLRWSKSTDRVKVSVLDQRLEESFDIHVAGAQALTAFYHPFAYAAGQNVCFGDALRETPDLQPQN
jgi:hypothetical protein